MRSPFRFPDVRRRSFRYHGAVSHLTSASLICMVVLAGTLSAQKTAPASVAMLPDCAPLAGQVLHCPKLGFTYKVPFGWVDRTQDLQRAPGGSTQQTAESNEQEKDKISGKTLLAVFERPPGTAGEPINSAVIIAIEARSSYPTIKTAADYFGPLADIAEQRGLKMDIDPYSFAVGSKQVVRGDFAGGSDKSPVRQTSLVILETNYILSFTFLSGSDDEIDSLVESLSFASGPRRSSPKQRHD